MKSIDRFQDPDQGVFIFMLSTRAGGLGINLTAADTVIIYDMDFNPQNDKQAEDRAHRIGQTKQVVVYKLVTEHAVDYKICEKAVIKLKLDQLIIQSGRMAKGTNALRKDEMNKIIEFGLSEIVKLDGATRPDNIDAIIENS